MRGGDETGRGRKPRPRYAKKDLIVSMSVVVEAEVAKSMRLTCITLPFSVIESSILAMLATIIENGIVGLV